MIKLLFFMMLVMANVCIAMDSDSSYSRLEGKRERQESDSSETGTKHAKVSASALSSKAKFYAIEPGDTSQVHTGTGRNNFMTQYMRVIVKQFGFEFSHQQEQLMQIAQEQDTNKLRDEKREEGIELKQNCIQCPGCTIVIQSDESTLVACRLLFTHWFTTRAHQPMLHNQASKLLALSTEEAKTNYKEH